MSETLFDVPPTAPLPDLVGSEKQREWAKQVRPTKLRHCREEIWRMQLMLERDSARGEPAKWMHQDRAQLEKARAALTRLEAETSAHWWIDQRDASAAELLGL